MDAPLADQVRQRARGCCEYCGLSEELSSTPFEIDHIVAEQHGGKAVLANLALACFADNHHKGPNLGGIDPKTGKKCWLYNPRRHKWTKHFRWDGPVLVGRTVVGRTTIAVLAINLPHRVLQRAALMEECRSPKIIQVANPSQRASAEGNTMKRPSAYLVLQD
jgi:hypothetical protein